MKLNAVKFGLAGGILFGVCLFLFTFLTLATGYGKEFTSLISSVYLGYEISLLGAFIGLGWAFVDAFIGFWLFAVIYNWLVGKN